MDFFSGNEWQLGKWATASTTTPSFCSSPSLRGKSSYQNYSEPRERKQNSAVLWCIRPRPRLGGLAVAGCSLFVDPGGRPWAIFFASHSSATRHQWLYLFSSRHECYTSAFGLTRTRLVSCIHLTSLLCSRTPRTTSLPEASPCTHRRLEPAFVPPHLVLCDHFHAKPSKLTGAFQENTGFQHNYPDQRQGAPGIVFIRVIRQRVSVRQWTLAIQRRLSGDLPPEISRVGTDSNKEFLQGTFARQRCSPC